VTAMNAMNAKGGEETDSNENPVFTFCAGFRHAAGLVQRWLFLIGFTSLLVGSATWLVATDGSRTHRAGGWQCLIGLCLIMASLLWGFWWRGHLRAAFRKEYGEES